MGLHVALVIFMVNQRLPQAKPPQRAAQVEINWLDAVKPEPAPTPAAQPPPAPHDRDKKKNAQAEPSPAQQAESATAVSDVPTLPNAMASDMPYAPVSPAGPKSPISKWVPNIGVVMQMPAASDAEGPHGQTIRNDPTERPDQVALHDYQSEQLGRKLNEEISQDLARAMAGAGNVPPFFKRIEKSMREKVGEAKVARRETSTGDKVRDIAGLLTPGMSMASANKVADSPLGQSIINRQVGSGSGTDDQRFREAALQSMAFSQTVIDRVSTPRLRTVLELTQDARGVLADVRVVEKSGDAIFDDSVMHFSRKVVRDLPDSDEQGLGTKWWRSRWQFTWEPPNVRVRLMEAYPLAPPVQ